MLSSTVVEATAIARPRRLPQQRSRGRYRIAPWLLLAPFCILFLAATVVPLVYAIYLSLFSQRLIGGNVFVGLSNYSSVLTDPLFISGLEHVAEFFLLQVPIMLALSVLAALALDSGRLRLMRLFRLGLFLPYAVPAVVATLMWGYIYGGQFGLLGEIAHRLNVSYPNLLTPQFILPSIANVVTWEFLGYDMLIFYAALRSVPVELYEAATVDGAGEIRKAWSIKVPALRPAMLLTLVFSFIGSFQLFAEPDLLKTIAPTSVTTSYTPNLYAYNLAFNGAQYNYAAAVAAVLGLVIVAASFVVYGISTGRRNRA